MRLKGRVEDFDFDFKRQQYYLKLLISDANIEEVNKYKNQDLIIEIKGPERAKTVSQNKFFWEIVTKIANHPDVMSTKDEIYKQMLLNYGEPIAELKAEKVNDVSGFDIHYILTKRGRKYNYYLVVKGISLMTSKEMTAFIEHAVNDAKELGIDTTPPWEWERLKKLWNR